MTVMKDSVQLVPVLKVNNRQKNVVFYQEVLGLSLLLEDGAFASLTDGSKQEKLLLEEVPGNRIRKVEGEKKLARLIFRAASPLEVETLLAQGLDYESLYQGPRGYGFEMTSPQGDRILLHAEDSWQDLVLCQEQPTFKAQPDFQGLSQVQLEQVQIRVPDVALAQEFYQGLGLPQLAFVAGQGSDLQVACDQTWDLTQLIVRSEDFSVASLQQYFEGQEVFVPKSEKFFLATDTSGIEVWFEKK